MLKKIAWLKYLFFPYGLWKIFKSWPQKIFQEDLELSSSISHIISYTIYIFIGLPITFFLTLELAIFTNEKVVGELAHFYMVSDFTLPSNEQFLLELPGPKYQYKEIEPNKFNQQSQKRRYSSLVERFSPVLIQHFSNKPIWDLPVSMDFDGNKDPTDNVKNTPQESIPAQIYGEVTAETSDSYYLTYSIFHIKDYDHPVREFLFKSTFHDNDNEGLHIRVDKNSLEISAIETWFHNRFFICNQSGRSLGDEPVQGKLHLEGGSHPIIYIQSMGHGVRCAQYTDSEIISKSTKIFRYRENKDHKLAKLDKSVEVDLTYDIKDFDYWYKFALYKNEEIKYQRNSLFSEAIPIGKKDGQELLMGRYFAGDQLSVGTWARPKPMWSWDDGWDELPIFIWHYYPALSFKTHLGEDVSQQYLHNHAIEKTFNLTASELWPHLDLKKRYRQGMGKDMKWMSLNRKDAKDDIDRTLYLKAIKVYFKRYINRVFKGLG